MRASQNDTHAPAALSMLQSRALRMAAQPRVLAAPSAAAQAAAAQPVLAQPAAAMRPAVQPSPSQGDSADWRSTGSFRIYCVTGSEGAPFVLSDALLHPALAGIALDTMTWAQAETRVPDLLSVRGSVDIFPVIVADGGSDALAFARSLAERFPGDHYHCLVLGDGAEEASWALETHPCFDVLPASPRPGELASRLRYLGRLAAERARRAAAEREALGLGQRLNESQGKLKLTRVLEEAVERLQRLSTTDGLTGITNRARFEEMLDLEWGQAVGEDFPLSLILIDIDYFKRYNDSYGHLLGDGCLQKVASALLTAREGSRDLVARYGGEEFVVLLPGRNEEAAKAVAERLRATVEALGIPNANSDISRTITLSAGVATAFPDLTSSASALVQRADRALYEAKRAGRNRVSNAE